MKIMRIRCSIVSLIMVASMILGVVPAYALTPTGSDYIQGTKAGGSVSTDVTIKFPGSGETENPNEPGGDDSGDDGRDENAEQGRYKIYYHYDDSIQRNFGYGFVGDKIPYDMTTPKSFSNSNWILESFDVAEYVSLEEEENTCNIYYVKDNVNKDGSPVAGGDGIPDKYQESTDLGTVLECYGYNVTYNYISGEDTLDGTEEEAGAASLGSAIPFSRSSVRTYNEQSYELDSISASSYTITPLEKQNSVSLNYISVDEGNASDSDKTPATYFVTFDPDNGDGIKTDTVEEGKTVTAPANPEKEGYEFLYWGYPESTLTDVVKPVPSDDGENHDVTVSEYVVTYKEYDFDTPVNANVGLKAIYQLKDTSAEYEVQHYKQALKADAFTDYVLADTEVKAGTVGENVSAVAKSYTGFEIDTQNENSIATETLQTEGTVLKLYYNRSEVTVTVDPDNGEESTTHTIKSGDTISVPETPTKGGYDFDGWAVDGKTFEFSTPIVSDTTITAMWVEAAADAQYAVAHYKQKLNKNGYEIADTDFIDSKDGMSVNAEARPYIGFTENATHKDRVTFGKVDVNSTLILRLFYDRIDYTVTVDPGNGEPTSEQTVTYGGTATKPDADPEKDGYIFTGWVDADSGLPIDWDAEITGDTRIVGSFVEDIPIVDYTINYHYDDEVSATTGKDKLGETIQYAAEENRPWKGQNYMFVKAEAVSSTITEDPGQNVVNVYYTKDAIGKDGGVNGGDGIPDNCQVTVTFNVRHGSPEKTQIVLTAYDAEGTPVKNGKATLGEGDIPQTAPITGYHNGAWDKTPAAGMKVSDGEEFTYTYDRIQYTVTIDPQNGESVQTQTIGHGDPATKPETDPQKEDYNFTGWVDAKTGAPVDWTAGITGDTKIVAAYVEIIYPTADYIVNYHYDNDVNTVTGQGRVGKNIPYGNEEQRTWKDKTFLFVRVDADSTVIAEDATQNVVDVYYTEDSIGKDGGVNGSDGIPDNCQITVSFTVENGIPAYTQRVLTAYGADEEPVQSEEAVLSAAVIPTPSPLEGYHNGSWNKTPTAGATVRDGDAFIYTYDRIQYSVTVDPNNGDDVDTQTIGHGDPATKPDTDPEKEGFSFAGWVNADTGLPVDWAAGITGDTRIIASFVAKITVADYTVHYHYDDDVGTFNGKGKIGDNIPSGNEERRVWKDQSYMYVKTVATSETITDDATKNVVDVYYTKDSIGKNGGVASGDGIPDNCQVVVTFTVMFGTPANTQRVLTAYNAEGMPVKSDEAILGINDIPQISPIDGYHNGSWDKTPVVGSKVNNGDKFIYTYDRIPSYNGGGSGGGGGGISTPSTVTITVVENEGSQVTPNGKVPVEVGKDKHFDIKADEGYVIVDVIVDGESLGPVTEYDFTKVKEDHTLEVKVAKMLSGDHIAYINGYPNGSVGPNKNISRSEVAAIFYRLLTDDARKLNAAKGTSFSDVKENAWYAESVATLAKMGILKGYADGTFKPDSPVSRAEFATIASRFDKLESGNKRFSDVAASHWAYEAISSAAAKGWVNGYSDGTFRPENAITRAEVAKLTNAVLDRACDKDYVNENVGKLTRFTDLEESFWAYYEIMEAANAHDYSSANGVETWIIVSK